MKQLKLLAAASVLATPVLSFPSFVSAMPLGDSLLDKGVVAAEGGSGKVWYDKGTRIEAPGMNLKLNVQIQDRATYTDYDEVSGRDVRDTTDFSVTLARLVLTGDVLDKAWSFKLENDFVSGKGSDGERGSELKDAWIQMNSDDALKVRAGQFKEPFSRQELDSDSSLQMLTRSRASNNFAPARRQGVMLHGDLMGAESKYAVGVFNGDSDNEGINRPGNDNNINGVAAVNFSSDNFGPRDVEGDHRSNDRSLAWTAGAAVRYGQGTTALGDGSTDFDKTDVNVDAGLLVEGFSAQTEFYYRNVSLDAVDGDGDSGDDFGFYFQTGYMIDPSMELAFRFGWLQPDDALASGTRFSDISGADLGTLDDQQEYAFVFNYFINGHDLKVQTGISWTVNNYTDAVNAEGDDNTLDSEYGVKLVGNF